MDVEGGGVLVPDTAAADVGLVRQNQRRRHSVHRLAGALVVVADGGDDGGDLLRVAVQIVQNAERHDGAGLRVVDPVHQIADVVEVACDLRHLHGPLRIAQGLQNIPRRLRHDGHMGEAVLREAQCNQRFVRPLDIGADGGVVLHVFKGQHQFVLPFPLKNSIIFAATCA